ncbi:MAG TPA: hypothetical protein VGE52_05360 [Pirellulales bacterium]
MQPQNVMADAPPSAPGSLVIPTSARESLLAAQPAEFREVDWAFHVYLEVLCTHPKWDDNQFELELAHRGVPRRLAEECPAFGPLAWGRTLVEQLGVECSPNFELHSLIDGREREFPLLNEPVFVWARLLAPFYHTPERESVFKLVAQRSVELELVSNALQNAPPNSTLAGSVLGPPLVYLRRPLAYL